MLGAFSSTVVQGAQDTWDGSGWSLALRFGAPGLLLVLVIVLVARALLRQRRYLAAGVLGPRERERLHAAVCAAERLTVGEVVPVVFARSDAHPVVTWRAGVLGAVLGSACLASWLPWPAPHWLLLCQLVLGAAAALLARWLPDLARTLVSEARATELAEEQAYQEFFRLKLHETAGRTGVLLFVSLFERRVVVLADEGIDRRVGADAWAATKDAVLAGIRRGSLCDGLVAGIGEVGALLEQHAPWSEGDRNELPDRIVVQGE
jgi:putative membrane protein